MMGFTLNLKKKLLSCSLVFPDADLYLSSGSGLVSYTVYIFAIRMLQS